MTPDGTPDHQLHNFLTAARARPADRGAGPRMLLLRPALTTRSAVDQFVPWSRHPDNTIDNLVAAHSACNRAKSASLASLHHLGHWLARFRPGDPAATALAHVASETGWPQRSDRALAAARAAYLWLPAGTRLWQAGTTYEPLDTAAMRGMFASLA